jgi:hypothetical protein
MIVTVKILHLLRKSLLPPLMPQSQYNDAEKGGFFVGFVRVVFLTSLQ